MLSRVADRLYWMARYLERAENTARLLDVHHALLLDLPNDADIGWSPILDILGCREPFDASASPSDAIAIQRYLIGDEENSSSLISCLQGARENARTTRDLIPTESWRTVNELLLYGQQHLGRASARSRHDVLAQVVSRCQTIAGQLAGTMSQGSAYQFIRTGCNLERADMTTRLIDVAASILLTGRKDLRRYDNTLWMAILRSLSAYQMYRQHVRRRVFGPDVITFLLADREFPRSVSRCLHEVEASLKTLPRPDYPLERLRDVIAELHSLDTLELTPGAIHELSDHLQVRIGAVHDAIRSTWLSPEEQAA